MQEIFDAESRQFIPLGPVMFRKKMSGNFTGVREVNDEDGFLYVDISDAELK